MSAPDAVKDVDGQIYLHAELLPNIRHVTLYISVPARLQNTDIFPIISLSGSRRSVSVSLPEPLDYVADAIKLPARVNEASRRQLMAVGRTGDCHIAQNTSGGSGGMPENDRREYSFRMQIDTETQPLHSLEDYMDTFVPWNAADMASLTKLRCSRCENIILEATPPRESNRANDSSPVWLCKDLPSGNWAEMMDFWHCHKPDPHEGAENSTASQITEDQNSQVKGYGAANQVRANPGTILVDVATFLVSDVDCKGLKKISDNSTADPSSQTEQDALWCENCDSLIGVEDTVARGLRLFKTSLSACLPQINNETGESQWKTHSTETIVAAQLLELIERESARRFVIHSGKEDGLLIWVFNPDLRYSNSSGDHSIASQRAMKIFFQTVTKVDEMLNPGPGKASSLSLEELKLPHQTFVSLANILEERNLMLPVTARTFREWKVGILHRFERT